MADAAADNGTSLGSSHAVDAESELYLDDAPTAAAKAGEIVMALDDAQLLVSDFILSVSTDPVILAFAEEMIVAHEFHMAATADVLAGLGLVPIVSQTSIALQQEAEGNLRRLMATGDFDFEFMRLQVSMHAEARVLVLVLADIAPYPELAGFLDDTVTEIENHRDEAVEILRNL